jgi:hypothetical protein
MAKKTGTTPQAVTSGLTKQEAVRRALAALGKQATAKDIQKHVKETFNLEMTIDHIYTAKSSALGKGKKKATKPTAKRPSPPEPIPGAKSPVQPAPVGHKTPGAISLGDIEAVKGLLGRLGADPLKALVDLLAR